MGARRFTIAILVPVFNRLDQTRNCLKILADQNKSAFFSNNDIFTIIADDGSTDGTSDYVKANYPEIIVLHGNGNLWWSGSMNLGIKYALDKLACDFILLWENDIMPLPNYFNNLQSILTERNENQIICSKIYYKVNAAVIFAMGGIFNSRTGYKKLIGRQENDAEEFQQAKVVDWFCGQGILIHKTVFEKIGYFDEKNFPQYHGDADFALRAKKAGFINIVYPQLKITNDTSTTGISHKKDKNLGQLLASLTSIRSNTNVIKDIKFYNRHTTNIFAYRALIKKYFVYIGSHVKWKVLGLFKKHKKYDEFY